jgi:flagellar basal body-associated protein FliL
MSDPIVPASAETPVPKKKSKGKIFLIIALIVLVVCGGGVVLAYFALGKAVDVAYAEGKCVDMLPTSTTAVAVTPKPVECSDSKAVAKILKVADGKTAAEAESICGAVPGAVSFVQITKTDGSNKLLCLGAK